MEFETVLEHHILDHNYRFFHFLGFTLPDTKHLHSMWIVCFLLMVCVPLIFRSRSRALWPLRAGIEGMVDFVRTDIVLANMGEAGLRYTPIFCTVFFFILGCNLLGMIPSFSTATGNISVTAAMAAMALFFILFAGMREQGVIKFFKTLVPHGVPGWLVPLLFPIELFGYLTKAFALCIRLFANMISGHIVLLSFVMMIFIFAQVNIVVDVLGVIPGQMVMSLFVLVLELFVAFLQAYIFTFLTSIFAGMAMHPH